MTLVYLVTFSFDPAKIFSQNKQLKLQYLTFGVFKVKL